MLRQKEEIDEFISSGKKLLDTNAQTIEEIGNMRNDARQLSAEFSGRITKIRWGVGDLAKLLKQSGGSGAQAAAAIDFSSLDSEWENLSSKLGQLETHLEAQKENLKAQITHRIADFQSKAEAFRDRWMEFKPKSMPQGDPTLVIGKLEDDFRALEDLREEGNKIRTDCEHFSMERPEFKVLDEVAADIESTREAWSRLVNSWKSRRTCPTVTGFPFGGSSMSLTFLAKWTERGGSEEEKDSVAVLLLETIEEYRKAIPALKFCRGEGWESSHWAQLFSAAIPDQGA